MLDLFMAGTAWAMGGAGGGAGGQQGSPWLTMLPLLLMFVIFYFLLIRPQQKKAKAHREMLGSLRKGDSVMTSGGIFGKITGLDDTTVVVEIAPQVRVKVSRANVAGVVGPGGAPPVAEKGAKK